MAVILNIVLVCVQAVQDVASAVLR